MQQMVWMDGARLTSNGLYREYALQVAAAEALER